MQGFFKKKKTIDELTLSSCWANGTDSAVSLLPSATP